MEIKKLNEELTRIINEIQISGRDAARLFGSAMGMSSEEIENAMYHEDPNEVKERYEIEFFGRYVDPDTGRKGDLESFIRESGFKSREEAEERAKEIESGIEDNFPCTRYSHYKISKY